jgi:hypothetical protein
MGRSQPAGDRLEGAPDGKALPRGAGNGWRILITEENDLKSGLIISISISLLILFIALLVHRWEWEHRQVMTWRVLLAGLRRKTETTMQTAKKLEPDRPGALPRSVG